MTTYEKLARQLNRMRVKVGQYESAGDHDRANFWAGKSADLLIRIENLSVKEAQAEWK